MSRIGCFSCYARHNATVAIIILSEGTCSLHRVITKFCPSIITYIFEIPTNPSALIRGGCNIFTVITMLSYAIRSLRHAFIASHFILVLIKSQVRKEIKNTQSLVHTGGPIHHIQGYLCNLQ